MINKIKACDIRSISEAISIIEQQTEDYFVLMDEVFQSLSENTIPIIGITGPPGVGKSTFVNRLISCFVQDGNRIGVLAVDPSNKDGGALLGDRIRFEDCWDSKQVFIRSLASRESISGLHHSVIDISFLFQLAGYQYVLIESVGVGQNETEIGDIADIVLLLLREDLGDGIQFLKAGIVDSADMLIINKMDLFPPAKIRHAVRLVRHDSSIYEVDSFSGSHYAKCYLDLRERLQKIETLSRENKVGYVIEKLFEVHLKKIFRENVFHHRQRGDGDNSLSPYKSARRFMDILNKKIRKIGDDEKN